MSKPLKVAYILTPITFGGLEKVSLNFLRFVDRSDFDIELILLIRPWEEESYFASEVRKMGFKYYAVPVAIKQNMGPFRVVNAAYCIYKILKTGSFDIIHTHGYFADICGLPIARFLSIRSVSTCHGFISTDFKLRVYNYLDKLSLKTCKNVIVVSDSLKEELIEAGIAFSAIKTIPNAVVLPVLSKIQEDRRMIRSALDVPDHVTLIGSVGRLSSEKGGRYLVEAFAKLVESGINARLVIVGDGPEKESITQLIKSVGIQEFVSCTGFVKDVQRWFPALDLFILPSLTEGTPIALLEAMAAIVPVVATSVGGVPKVIEDGLNGFLVPPGDSIALYKKIQFLIMNPDIKNRIGLQGHETIRSEYTIEKWIQNIENCYKNELHG
ncbi:MAG: glycosyltransferase [Pedobacter sp.]